MTRNKEWETYNDVYLPCCIHMKKMNIAFAWWWTGWHVTPIRSLIEYAQQDTEISSHINTYYWFWSTWQLEERFAKELDHVSFVSIFSWKRRRQPWITYFRENIIDLWKFVRWCFQSLQLLKKHKIDHVFCKWWYVALPVCVAAGILCIPVSVHESDMYPWLVNKLVSKWATYRFCWFEDSLNDAEVIGQILSLSLSPENHYPVEIKNYNPSRPTYLFICGSQWSTSIFKQLWQQLDRWWLFVKDANIVVILWLLNESMGIKFKKYDNVTTFDFCSSAQLWYLYSLADLAVTRWSATVLAELEMFWIPKIIVPLPYSVDQPKNATWYAKAYWDIVLNQDSLSDLWSTLSIVSQKKRDSEKKDISIVHAHKSIWEKILQ